MFGNWGAVAADNGCPNCGHKPYKEKDHCEKCGFLKPETKKGSDAYFIFCKKCGCHYMSENGACSLHGMEFVEPGKLPKPNT